MAIFAAICLMEVRNELHLTLHRAVECLSGVRHRRNSLKTVLESSFRVLFCLDTNTR
jgi:hypothetical protein